MLFIDWQCQLFRQARGSLYSSLSEANKPKVRAMVDRIEQLEIQLSEMQTEEADTNERRTI